MNVSKTELTALLKQALEGLGFHCGEYESAADMVVWAQMAGLEGVQELQRSLPYLIEHQSPPLEYISEDNTDAVIDARNGSALNCADVVVNLAYVKALAQGYSSVTVLNCHTQKLLIKAIVDCSRRGMACLMYWRDVNDPATQHIVSVEPRAGADTFPHYTTFGIRAQDTFENIEHQSLIIRCAEQWHTLEKYRAAVLSQDGEQCTTIEPESMRSNYHSAMCRGLPIDPSFWEHLLNLSQAVLIESSEQSRMGAGA